MSSGRDSDIKQRKSDHIQIALNHDVGYHTVSTGFDRYRFITESLPEINKADIDTSTELLGKRLSMPLIISSMTGGTEESAEYNRRFAKAAQKIRIAMGVGSQRIALDNPALEDTFRVRDIAPDVLLFANLGAVQLNYKYDIDSYKRAVEMIDADAIMLHINPLQECIQQNGNTDFSNLAAKIGDVCNALDVPVIVKEVGHGISANTAKYLINAGVDGIDIAGAGGTSWAKVESIRENDSKLSAIGAALGELGIPTVDSLLAVRNLSPNLIVIASGGVRCGQDIAKSIALGANAAGIAQPFLKAAAQSQNALYEMIDMLHEELVTVMFCTGCKTISNLHHAGLLAPSATFLQNA